MPAKIFSVASPPKAVPAFGHCPKRGTEKVRRLGIPLSNSKNAVEPGMRDLNVRQSEFVLL